MKIENPQIPYPSFPLPLETYEGMKDILVRDDACRLDPKLVIKMPLGYAGYYTVQTDKGAYTIQVAKAESIPLAVSLRLASNADHRYKMEARVIRNLHLIGTMEEKCGTVPKFLSSPKNVVLAFDLITKVQGRYFPPLRARSFIPWALKALRNYPITHILADFEPGTETHGQFLEDYRKTKDALTSMQLSWAHRQITNAGFKIMPFVYLLARTNEPLTVHGIPNCSFYTFYEKK